MDSLALAAGVTNLGATLVYVFVGYRLLQRPVAAPARLAAVQFTIWWYGLGASTALTGIEGILVAFGQLTFSLAFTILLVMLLVDSAFLWGLLGYLLYVYTGQYLIVPLSAFYAAFYAITLYFVVSQDPYGVIVASGIPTLQYAFAPNPALLSFVISGLLVPEIGGALLYLSLIRRTRDRTQRYRISLVSASILLWFAIAIAVPSTSTGWQLVKGLLESVAALLSLIAFLPPGWIRTRLQVRAVEGPDSDTTASRSGS